VVKVIISTDNAPSAIGPYSQAICVKGALTFTSGQIPLDPITGNLISDDFEEQAIQTLKNIKYILKERDKTLNDIVKLTVFLTDLSNFDNLNKTFNLFFNGNYPARSVVEVSKLPKNSKIEIEAIFNDEL
tara:strand:+ start:303 stop:692 length:390 start_codon:yes stop_codon:yes gene_type:complete